MAGVTLISTRPPSRSPSQTLSDIGIVLPSLHLGSFSQMTFDSISPPSEEQQRSPILQTPTSSRRVRARISTTQGDDSRMHERNRSAINGGALPSARASDTRSRREDTLEGDYPSTPSTARRASLQPLLTSGSGVYLGRPAGLPIDSYDPTVQGDGAAAVRAETASVISGEDTPRNRPSDTQLKVFNGPRRVDSAEYKYDTPVSVRTSSFLQYPSPSSTSPPSQIRAADAPLQYVTSPVAQDSTSSPVPSVTKVFIRPQIAQKVTPPEEVCVECMLRDRDMADVDVTSPGVWERESDVWYEELVRREVQEARDGILPSGNSNKPRSRGGRLTEGNLAIWLTLNPKEPAARWQTLEKYIKSQAEYLAAELEAREQTFREARLRDTKMREAYHQLRRSTADIGRTNDSSSPGVRLRASTGIDDSDARDVTLLESGLILERVDIRRQEREERERKKAEERAEKRRTRKMSRVSVGETGRGFASDASSMHSLSNPLQNVSYGSRSQISLLSPSISANKRLSSPLTPSLPLPMSRGQSQNSMEPTAPRFFGFKHWRGAYGSEASLHNNSGSMMDMHLGLEQDRDAMVPFDDEPWSAIQLADGAPTLAAEEEAKPKKHTIGRLWKKMTGKDKDSSRSKRPQHPQDDLDVPLDPPPPLSYLVSRSNGHERTPHIRHVSSPPVQSSGSSFFQPRSPSLPVLPPIPPGVGASASLPSSAASQRFSLRDGLFGEERRHSGPTDEVEAEVATEDGSLERRERIPGVQTYSGKPRSVTYSTSEPWRQSSYPSPIDVSFSLPHFGGGNSRQLSTFSFDKELPPLPNEAFLTARSQPTLRPFTTYDPPSAPFKTDARRQSFNDLFSRPVAQTFGNFISRSRKNSDALVPPPPLFGTFQVDEFGASAPSLGRWEDEPSHYAALSLSLSPTKSEKSSKRRSRFTSGLSSIFGSSSSSSGRRSAEREMQLRDAALDGTGLAPNDGQIYPRFTDQYPMSRGSRSEVALRHSSASVVTFSRPPPSSASTKRFDSLIPQESDFVALRYPTESERVDLVRQS